jgi:hypothetical protein
MSLRGAAVIGQPDELWILRLESSSYLIASGFWEAATVAIPYEVETTRNEL